MPRFGTSRVTGYNIYNRYKECGLDALNDRSRAPYRKDITYRKTYGEVSRAVANPEMVAEA